MTEPRRPDESNAKAGVKPGSTPTRDPRDGGERPVSEEDAFGGAERVRKGKDVKSEDAKP